MARLVAKSTINYATQVIPPASTDLVPFNDHPIVPVLFNLPQGDSTAKNMMYQDRFQGKAILDVSLGLSG